MTAMLTVALPQCALADAPPEPEELEKKLEKSIGILMETLKKLIDNIPQYEAPIINEQGDIIIRRKRDEENGTADEPPREI